MIILLLICSLLFGIPWTWINNEGYLAYSLKQLFLFISLCGGDNTLTFYEKNLTLQEMSTYSDNSVVIRLVERLNVTCNVPNLTYKILYSNGTVSNLITIYDYDHQIPSFNFCTNEVQGKEEQIVRDRLTLIETITNYVLVIYDKFIEVSNLTLTFGMMIDWSGKITR